MKGQGLAGDHLMLPFDLFLPFLCLVIVIEILILQLSVHIIARSCNSVFSGLVFLVVAKVTIAVLEIK